MNIQQLRAQVASLQNATMDDNKNFRSDYDEGKFDALSAVDELLDSLQEEQDLRCGECAKKSYDKGYFDGHIHDGDRIVHVDGRKVNVSRFRRVAKPLEEPISEDLEKEISDYFQGWYKDEDLGLTKSDGWSCIVKDVEKVARHFANWQKEQFEKNRLASCDKQTEEEAKIEFDFVMGIIENEHRQPTFDDAIKYGMRLKDKEMQSTIELAEDHAMLAGMEKMKEQMMKDAFECEVKVDAGGYPYIPQIELYDYDKDVPFAKEGDKYKVILIKEG